MKLNDSKTNSNCDIAIIGMSGRFPGAENIASFWDIIKDGKEEISFYSTEELLEKGVNQELLNNPGYVFADSLIESADKFDSSFFGYTPREADFMDPQHRIFLEESFSALENAGYDPERYTGEIGVFAGCSMNRYLIKNLLQHNEILNSLGELQTIINNDKDFLTTRVSYKLNLKGPSVDLQTACSTSLVAIHFGCQSLVTHQCDMALSGGVFLKNPRGEGYIFEEGSIDSPTGHCHPFDKEANGTIFGEGVGVVVLKRLEDAVRDRDTIIAIIKGTAINNDGSLKVGYMAPGISGQAKVISKAFDIAGIDADTVSYIETHGTGTKMGDPIEIEALRRVFSSKSKRINYCALGSVKANIGHLDVAAGVAGLIKSALVLKNRQIPPLINFTSPNPELDLENSPFYINKELKNWDAGEVPRRAAVSSFGIGGTNSHAILEEWIPIPSESSSRRFHLLPLSAKSEGALQRMYDNLIMHLSQTTDNIADIAYTLQNGRKEFKNRGMLIWDNSDENNPVFSDFPYFKGSQKLFNPGTIFMFTGQGSQYSNMARGLYEHFDSVKIIMDYADTLLNANHNLNLLETVFSDEERNKEKMNQTSVAQPALFVVQYAVAHLLREFGIIPNAMIGHSIGEITAACLSGVFSFEDALNMVAWRGKLMQEQVPGSMLSVNLSKDQVLPLIDGNVELALNNAPDFCVVSGSFDAIDLFREKLSETYPHCHVTRLKTSHAFHSRLMEPALKPFLQVLKEIEFGSISIPFISNVTGTWITVEAATSPEYWASHIRSMVNFTDGVYEIAGDENNLFIEVGPGNTLSTLLSRFRTKSQLTCLSTLRHPRQASNDIEFFFNSISGFWLNGGIINWSYIYHDEERYRVPLPSYPFEKIKHWVDPRIQNSYHITSRDVQLGTTPALISEPVSPEVGSGSSEFLHNRPIMDNEFISADSGIEKRIASIWEDLLGIKGIGVTDNFFFLGGHSLLASQIINRVSEEFNAEITIEDFFNFPTIRGLIGNSTFKPEFKELVPETVTDYSLPQALSPAQERLWIVSQIENNNPSYNISFSYVFEGTLDKELFKKSLEELFERHKILKSSIRIIKENPFVVINHDFRINISEIDFSGFSDIDQDNKVQDFIKNESRTKFSLEDSSLYRITLLNLGKERIIFNLTIHHLIFDGWSWGLFTKELKEIYNSLLRGEKAKLEPLPFDYFEFARLAKEEGKYKSLEEYWRNKLKGITGKLNFPLDYKRQEISTGEGGRVALDIGKERSAKFREYSKKENVTLYMLFLSVFGFLLSRYSGDKDICIGSPTANRPVSKLEKLIGLFINSIVLRLQIDEEISFSTFLSKVKSVSLEALSNQGLSFETLVDILHPERILNVNPVFQVMFAWQNAPRPPLELNGIKSTRVFQEKGVSPLDITLYAWEEEENIVGEIEFSTDILKRSTIESLRENFIFLLDCVVSNPEICLNNIPILSDHEKQRIAEFNNTDAKVPEVPLQVMFEGAVNKYSDKTAIEVISSGRRITYSNLQKLSNQLANYLQKKGFRKGSIAGISMDRSESMIVAVLGVLKAGGTYLPLDPSYPDDRLFYMLEDSGASALITEEIYRNRFKNSESIKIVYDTEQSYISGESSHDLSNKIDLNTIAYIIYTSGSSGNPKGVKVHHKAVVNLINSMSKVPGLSFEDRLLAVTTLSFDISVMELFLPLSFGATVILADHEHTRDGQELARIIEQFHISILQATPATWTILLASGWMGQKGLKALCGGEALQPGLARDLIGKVNSLWNMYGPTETTIWSSCELVTDYNHILIGKPIDNTQFHILYVNQEQPVGAIGELCIGGMGVSKGYHKREELNLQKFINWNDQILYRTGDLARFLDNGKIELLGRTDDQIKLHGYRIEPGEIEFQLSQIDGVKEAVVKLEKHGVLDERLIGYLNVTDSFNFNREQIAGSIGKLLPGYMVPSAFMVMKEFPRTLNGKIDRKALIFDINNIHEQDEEEITELSDFEKSLAKIWQEVLKIKNIKKNQNFFDIGGNSFLAIRTLTRIKEELNLSISFKTLLQNPTINNLSSQLEENGQIARKSIDLIHLTGLTDLPLTLNQKRLWLISRLHPDIPSYIIQYSCQMQGSLDREVFQKSLEILFNRHHIVFSVIKEINGEPYCDIVPKEVNISFIDYSGLPEIEKEIKVIDLINADSRKVFELENGPLYRLYLIMTNADEYYFHLSIHHIVFDGWSWTVLVKELNEVYTSLINKKEPDLEKIDYQLYDYAQWENNSANFSKRNDLIDFWKNTLKEASPILNFPYDFQRREHPSGKAKHEPIHLSKEITEKLRTISKKEKSSLFTTMLSVFGIQMHKYSGQDDINIGLPVVSRPYSKLENIFGMFVNTVVVRLKFDKNLTFKHIIRQTNETALNAIAHQELPFESIVDLVNPVRVSNTNPLFQIGFLWQNNLNEPLKLDRIRSKRITGTDRTTPFDIVMYLWEDGETIEGEIEYSSDLLKHETIVRLKDNFLTLINKLLENSDTVLETLSIISDNDKKLIENINNTNTPYPKNKTIVQLFEDQVTLYPDKTAVAFNEDFLTYKQLNEKTNQLARTLRESGIGSDSPVGILIEKSLDLIVGILGILKAGGGYVPIEPEFPEQRIDFIIKDSGCKVLLTQDKFINIEVEGVTKLNLNSIDSYHSDASDVERINDSSSLAYIMYTSGTTGKPKGSMILQNGVVRLVRNTNYIEFLPEDRILLTGAIGFDVTTFEIWGALLNGCTLYVAEKETIINPKTLGEELRKNDISILWLTSALLTMIAESTTDIFNKLKYLLSGGDVLSASHINKVRKHNPQLKIINGYGPTENTTFSTTYLIERDFDRNIPIGKPISNSTAYIFDKYMNYQPIGVIGELYVGGDGVSKGYLNHEDLNRKSFLDHPYIQGEKIYKTGDFARWLNDGNIEFHGRMDNQLKIRGFRVELGEIESVLSEMEGIIDVVIKPIKINEGDIRLAAFLDVSDAFNMDSKELGRRIKEKLPPQMIPSIFRIMHGFPKTVNGKIDKNALIIDMNAMRIEEPQENGLLTPTEKTIYDVWSKVLTTKDILKTDNFFDIGGSSLLAASVLSRLESSIKVNIRLKTFFDNPRLVDLAEFIDGTLPRSNK